MLDPEKGGAIMISASSAEQMQAKLWHFEKGPPQNEGVKAENED